MLSPLTSEADRPQVAKGTNPTRREFIREKLPLLLGMGVFSITEGITTRVRNQDEERRSRTVRESRERQVITETFGIEGEEMQVTFMSGNHVLTQDHAEVLAKMDVVTGELNLSKLDVINFPEESIVGGIAMVDRAQMGSTTEELREQRSILRQLLDQGKRIITTDTFGEFFSLGYPYPSILSALDNYGYLATTALFIPGIVGMARLVKEENIKRRDFIKGAVRIMSIVTPYVLFQSAAGSLVRLFATHHVSDNPIDIVNPITERRSQLAAGAERIMRTLLGIEKDEFAAMGDRLVYFRNAHMIQNLWHILSLCPQHEKKSIGDFFGSGHSEMSALFVEGPLQSEETLRYFIGKMFTGRLEVDKYNSFATRYKRDTSADGYVITNDDIDNAFVSKIVSDLSLCSPALVFQKNRGLATEIDIVGIGRYKKPAWQIAFEEIEIRLDNASSNFERRMLELIRKQVVLSLQGQYLSREIIMNAYVQGKTVGSTKYINADPALADQIMANATFFKGIFPIPEKIPNETSVSTRVERLLIPSGTVLYNGEQQLMLWEISYNNNDRAVSLRNLVTTGTGGLLVLNDMPIDS